MEMPEERVVPFLRRERLTDLRIDLAIALADLFLNTRGSRSIASLVDWTRATHLLLLRVFTQQDRIDAGADKWGLVSRSHPIKGGLRLLASGAPSLFHYEVFNKEFHHPIAVQPSV